MLSVCIITKNEEKNIARCLKCLAPYGFEIIVVDTGSKDNTKKEALKYTNNVYDYLWQEDFSAARNFAVSKATKAYVFMVDSDEFLEPFSKKELEKCIGENPGMVGRVYRKNQFTRDGQPQENREWINRLFPRERYHYEGTIHEQLVGMDGEDYLTYHTPLILLHTGYDLPVEQRKEKARRNARLLEKERALLIEQQDESKLPYVLYQLGKSAYMAQEYNKACEYFSQGLSFDLNPKLEYVIDMVETYGYALLNSKQEQQALFFENIYQEFAGSGDFQFLMGLIYMNNARFEQAVEEFKKATKHKECRSKGVNSYLSYYNIGVIYECMGKIQLAVEYYRKAKDYEPAKKRLQEI